MKDSNPILIFKGDINLCSGILYSFSVQLAKALSALGEDIIFFDTGKDRPEDYLGRKFKAVIGFMEVFFYNTLPDSDKLLFDMIDGPKFNYWTDHPAFYYHYMKRIPKDYFILTEDRNYVNFINKYYKNTRAFFLPPGGIEPEEQVPFGKRKFDLIFLGTYVNWKDTVKTFENIDDTTTIIVSNYLEYLIRNPELTAEEAFVRVLDDLGAKVTEEEYLNELCKIHKLAGWGAARLYKEMIIERILQSGITLNVFGDSWKESPFSGNRHLKINPAVRAESVSEIYMQSKMSLNIMTWHKDSITERVLDSMMSGSIVITDETDALKEAFTDKEELLFFSLKNIDMVPEIISENMDNEKIAEKGHLRALNEHSWMKRAEMLKEIIEGLSK